MHRHHGAGVVVLVALGTTAAVLFAMLSATYFVPSLEGPPPPPPPTPPCTPPPGQVACVNGPVSGHLISPQQFQYWNELPAFRLTLEVSIGIVVLLAAAIAVHKPAGPHSRRIGK